MAVRRASAPSGTPASASTIWSGGASRRTRSSRGSTSVPLPPSRDEDEDRPPERREPSSRARPGAAKPASIRPRSFVDPALPDIAIEAVDRLDAAAGRGRCSIRGGKSGKRCTGAGRESQGLRGAGGQQNSQNAQHPTPKTRELLGVGSWELGVDLVLLRSVNLLLDLRLFDHSPSPASARCQAAIASARRFCFSRRSRGGPG